MLGLVQSSNTVFSLVTDLLGDVQAQSVHDVSEEEEVDLALAIPIVDVADVLDLCLIDHLYNTQ